MRAGSWKWFVRRRVDLGFQLAFKDRLRKQRKRYRRYWELVVDYLCDSVRMVLYNIVRTVVLHS